MEEDGAHPQQGGGGPAGVRLIFKAMVQAVLLFGSDTWVVIPRMVKALGEFQSQVAIQLKGGSHGGHRTGSGYTHRR